ncbi:hypothetical protein LUZ63_008859 [Rhynchospora breviuscula]|uniref:DUF4220 domain-containing protein n=1 Tax=Rhynchospora breviuscula TaxID=2022672 RepID=A0A9Q0CDY0_9POAL|nr:hypothetical protein LUZ63_008859 [Rhynchospora breviuscula]
MHGYKYLVMGEEREHCKIEAPDYTTKVELTADVVTVERVWCCKERLLHPSVDTNGSLKDVCLSFALFKLLRRRYFGYPAVEAQQPKTKELVFGGLLSVKSERTAKAEVDKERVFRVIKMEIGFLRDYFFTRNNFSHAANQLASSEAGLPKTHLWLLYYKVLAIFCKPKFSLSVKSTLGQYSLVRNCNKSSLSRSSISRLFISATSCKEAPPPGLKKSKEVILSEHVKNAIFYNLARSRGELTNGTATLQRYEHHDLMWTLNLAAPVHTIMVWHIATSFCEIHPVKEAANKESIEPNLTVATHLSNYCAYLVAFRPDLLPLTSCYSVKYVFRKVFEETCEFFGREKKLEGKYQMMSCGDGGLQIIHQGSALGRYLSENINDDNERWKIIAEFWSELILFIAPSGSTRQHIERLGNGSEFITHLWALLYHGGIVDTSSAEYHL